jgi:septal ring factor EnvC (AmiA/AmiB activator)
MIRNSRIAILGSLVLMIFFQGSVVRGETEQQRLDREKRERESEIRSAEQELRRIEAELRRLGTVSRTNRTRIEAAQLELRRAQEQVRIQQARVTVARSEVRRLAGEIGIAEKNISKRRVRLNARARALMRLSRLQNLEFLLKAGDAAEMELRGHMLSTVAEADVRLIRETVAAKEMMQSLKATKEKALATLVDEERQLAAARNNVDARKRELERAQAEINRQTNTQLAAKERVKEMMGKIRTRLAQIQATLDRIARSRVEPARTSRPGTGAWFKPEGIDISGIYVRAAQGSSVRVMAEGEVASIQSIHGLGQTVIVGHGGGLTSVYGNLSGVSVAVGQDLARGAAIGRSGESPYGDAFYFAVYRTGVAQDASRYMR